MKKIAHRAQSIVTVDGEAAAAALTARRRQFRTVRACEADRENDVVSH